MKMKKIYVAGLASAIVLMPALNVGAIPDEPLTNTSRQTVIGSIILDSARNGADTVEGVVLNITNGTNLRVSQSGSFRAKDSQTLILNITSDINGGFVDLFLFCPNGREQHRITIGVTENVTKEIALADGVWAYNAFGIFRSGNITITGTFKE